MSLFDIKDKLYKRKVSKDISQHQVSQYNPKTEKLNEEPSKFQKEDLWLKKKQGLGATEKKVIKKGILALGIIIAIILISAITYEVRRVVFTKSGVFMSIDGSTQARSGKLLTYTIKYKNNNWVDIKNTTLEISYPEAFKPTNNTNFQKESPTSGIIKLGTIKRHSQGKVVFNGKAYSPKGALIYLRANLKYQPSSFSGQFQTKSQIGVNITSAPISVEIEAPQNISSGNQINYLITYRNNGSEAFENLKIKIDYPDQFTFSHSNPRSLEGNNIWYLGNLSPGQSGKIIITGKLEGERNKIKTARVYIGTTEQDGFMSYSEESIATKIVASPLSITQTVNGVQHLNVNAGEILNFKIMFKNDGNIGLRDVIVKEKLASSVLDYSTLDMQGGSYNADDKIITWKASDIPNFKSLDPGQGGTIIFSIQIKNVIQVKNKNDKNFVISSVATIDSPDIPTPITMNKIIAGNIMDMKLNSKLILATKGYYDDQKISNSGPIPPKVGQATTYTIHWLITNISNDLSKAKVEAFLPTNALMTGKTFPTGANLDYNQRTNSIVWNVGNVKSGVGILTSPKEVAFQVQIKPSPDQIGKEVKLLGQSILTAKDDFTEANLKQVSNQKTTNLSEDSSLISKSRVTN